MRIRFFIDGNSIKSRIVKIPVFSGLKVKNATTYKIIFTDYFKFDPWKCPEIR